MLVVFIRMLFIMFCFCLLFFVIFFVVVLLLVFVVECVDLLICNVIVVDVEYVSMLVG